MRRRMLLVASVGVAAVSYAVTACERHPSAGNLTAPPPNQTTAPVAGNLAAPVAPSATAPDAPDAAVPQAPVDAGAKPRPLRVPPSPVGGNLAPP